MNESEDTTRESTESGSLFITIVISVILIVLAGGLAYNLGQSNHFEPDPQGATVELKPTDLGKKLHLDLAKTTALINMNNGYLGVTIDPEDGFVLPQGTTFEAFLVDAGTIGDFGTSSETVADEFYEPTLSNNEVDTEYDKVPYALSVGRVKQDTTSMDYTIEFNFQNTLMPYDRILLTLESDTDRLDYDPRPGAVVFQAEIPENLKPRKALVEAQQDSNEAKQQ